MSFCEATQVFCAFYRPPRIAMSLNPNASSFSFNPNATGWTPSAPTPAPAPAPAPVPPPMPPPGPPPADPEPVEDGAGGVSAEEIAELKAMLAAGDITQAEFDEAVGGGGDDAGGADAEEDWEAAADADAAAADADGGAEESKGAEPSESAPASAPSKPVDAGAAAEDDAEAALKKRGLEVVDEDPRQHINLVFIGHVDAGKSTLCGSILYRTGHVDKRTIERFEREAKERNRESWFLAFIMDTSEEERAKGKTVEVGRAHFESEARRFTILDAPGHKNYVPQMINGASQADVGVLVISARKGEFETGFERGGQTREHAVLARTLGVNKLVVVVNKMDDPTVKWEKARFDEIQKKLRPFLKSQGYKVKKEVLWVPISALTGANVLDPVDRAECPWIDELDTKTPLLETLNILEISGRDPAGPVCVPVMDRYSERGTVVLGKVERGTLRIGQKLVVSPGNKSTKVNQIEVKEDVVATAKCGENVLVKCDKCDLTDIQKGFVLCDASAPLPATCLVTVQMALIDLLEHRPIFTAGYDCVFHAHTAAEEVVVEKLLEETVASKDGPKKKKNPTFCKKNSMVTCQLKLAQSLVVTPFEVMECLGRFTLRDEGKTIAIGKIISID